MLFTLNGLDKPVMATAADFRKALEYEKENSLIPVPEGCNPLLQIQKTGERTHH